MGFPRGTLAIAAALLGGCGDNIHLGGGTLIVSPQADLRTTESGGTAMFTVALANEPLREITVDLTSMAPTEGTVSPSQLTFRPASYDQPHTVVITGVDDDRADGNKPYLVRVDGPGVGAVDVDVTNEDDDIADIAVSPLLGLMTSEGGMTAQFEVQLTSRPLADVTIPVASADGSEGTADRTTLTFSEDNWSAPQVVMVTGQQDAIADGSVSYSIVLAAATSMDGAYDGLDPDDVTVLNVDDDAHGITVNAPAGLATVESGTQDSFTVVLQTQPTADVTIAVGSTVGSEASASPAQLVFTAANWDQPQTVTATGVDDHMDDGDQAFVITLAAATSSDASYAGLDPSDVSGTNADDDTAGIVVSPTSGLVTSEAGGAAGFTVVLSSQPADDVTIAVTSSDLSEGSVTPTLLTFTAATWNLPAVVTVTGLDDAVSDGNQAYTIVLSPAVSADAGYSGMNPSDVAVTNLDNDTTGVTVDPTDGLFVSELGDTDTFTLTLDSAPSAPVTITLATSDPSEGTVQPATVMFTPANWDIPQPITVTGVDDTLSDGNIDFTIITGAASSLDPAYNGLAIADVQVTNIDDDTAQVYVKARRRILVSENGQSATFRVRLTVPPTQPVTCTLMSTDTTEGLVSPQTLVFRPNQFGFQLVTVSGVDDQVIDGDVQFTIVLNACTSADPQYNNSNPRDVTAINRDND